MGTQELIHKIKLPEFYWDLIEEFYPNYDHSTDINHNDILQKFIDGELDNLKDMQFIIEKFPDAEYTEELKEELDKENKKLFHYAATEMFCQRIGDPNLHRHNTDFFNLNDLKKALNTIQDKPEISINTPPEVIFVQLTEAAWKYKHLK